MNKGLLRLLALMVALFIVLGAAAGCGKKKATTDSGKDTTVEETSNDQTVADQETSTSTNDSTDVESTDKSADATDKADDTKSDDNKKDDTKPSQSDSKSDSKSDSNKSNGNKTSTTNKGNTSGQSGTVAKVDLKGYDVKVACWWNLDPKTAGNIYYQKAVDREKQVKAKYNIKFKWINVPGQGLKDKLASSVLAGDPIGDIARCRSGWVLPTLAGKGYVEPADKYFDVSDPLWNPVVTKQSMYKGHPMGVNHMSTGFAQAMLYNRSMIQRAGLADPYTLIASKQWTWSKFEEYAKALAKDTNNDGKLDVFGSNFPRWMSVIGSNSGRIVSEINNKDVFTLNKPESVEALKWIQNLSKMNILGGDMSDFAGGKVGFAWWPSWQWDFKGTMKDKWGLLPCPIGPKAKDYNSWCDEVHLMCIPANSKHPKEVAAIWRDYNAWYPGVSGRDQMQKESAENTYVDQRDVQTAVMLSNKMWLDKFFAYDDVMSQLWPGGGQDVENVIDGSANKSIDQFVSQIADKCQNSIDQLWASLSK